MLLSFDIAAEAVAEHDDWHTHEHLPERLSIPGFVRGSRWVAIDDAPRYMVIHEVQQLATLTSKAYLERLNNPSPWTSKMMPSYRGMTRGLCSVAGSFGLGMGGLGLFARFRPSAGAEASLRRWVCDEALPTLTAKQGLGGAHLLEAAATAQMTSEQRMRGADAAVDCALVITGYNWDALARLARSERVVHELPGRGALALTTGVYQLVYALGADEIDAPSTERASAESPIVRPPRKD